jgi:hypothetical protein
MGDGVVVRSVSWVLALCAVVAAAGCAVSGRPVPAPSGTAGSAPTSAVTVAGLTSKRAFGDLATLDPCGFAQPATIPASLRAEITPESQYAMPMDTCLLTIFLGKTPVYLSVGPLSAASPGDFADPAGMHTVGDGVQLATSDVGDTGSCTADLLFPDQVYLEVDGDTDDPSVTPDVCPDTDTVAQSIAQQILAGSTRHWKAGSVTFSRTRACSLLTKAEVSANNLVADPSPTLVQHQCTWLGSGLSVELVFLVGDRPTRDLATDVDRFVAGRPTVVRPGVTDCVAETAGPALGTSGQYEIAEVDAYQDGSVPASVPQACDLAGAIAADVWSRLPTF